MGVGHGVPASRVESDSLDANNPSDSYNYNEEHCQPRECETGWMANGASGDIRRCFDKNSFKTNSVQKILEIFS